MAYIYVNRPQFLTSAKAIEDYVDLCKHEMTKANQSETGLGGAWLGADAADFDVKWRSLCDKGSAYSQMLEALENYAKYLRYAEAQYRYVQNKATDRARRLK